MTPPDLQPAIAVRGVRIAFPSHPNRGPNSLPAAARHRSRRRFATHPSFDPGQPPIIFIMAKQWHCLIPGQDREVGPELMLARDLSESGHSDGSVAHSRRLKYGPRQSSSCVKAIVHAKFSGQT
jgi:hypothetical protein